MLVLVKYFGDFGYNLLSYDGENSNIHLSTTPLTIIRIIYRSINLLPHESENFEFRNFLKTFWYFFCVPLYSMYIEFCSCWKLIFSIPTSVIFLWFSKLSRIIILILVHFWCVLTAFYKLRLVIFSYSTFRPPIGTYKWIYSIWTYCGDVYK